MIKTENKPRIMIVDDVPANIKILLSILSDDYKLFIATNGQNALDVILAKPVDLILLDILMPEMDGFEVCRRLKANKTTQDIPVIFITGVCDPESEKTGLDLGAVDYISKPFSPAVVKARVKNHLTLQSSLLQLKKQNQALQEAEELRKQVEGITRHDMKSPLNGIIGFSDFLLMANDIPSHHLEYLRIIRRQGFRSLHMINLSLELLRMEQGTFTLVPKEVDMVAILHEIGSDLERLIKEKQLIFEIYLNAHVINSGEKFIIWGEELLCFSIFSNLVKNAIEASPQRGIVTIRFRSEEAMNAIEVCNQGAIPEQIRERFFEKYVTFGKSAGTGLGTYSARLITEAQGGRISLEPAAANEIVIVVRLPKAKSID
ncbi:conserved hypothetical protein [Gammaproteobacteria bacterium]